MASLAYITSLSPPRAGAIFTATAASIGTASASRRVVCTAARENGRSLTSATIGGIAATVHTTGVTSNASCAVFSAIVPTGTTADIVMTMNGTLFADIRLSIYTVDDNDLADGDNPSTATNTVTGTSLTTNYTSFAGAVSLIAVGFGFSSKAPISNNRSFIERNADNTYYNASLDSDSSGAQSIDVTWGASSSARSSVVSWELVSAGADIALEGNATDTVTATGSLTTSIKLTALAVSNAIATGGLLSQILLDADAQAISTASGGLTTQINLTGASVSLASGTGDLTVGANGAISGDAFSISNADADLTTAIQLAGSAISLTDANGELTAQISLSGSALAQALASSGLTTSINLSGSAESIALAAAELLTIINLTGNADSTLLATATITTSINLTGNAVSNANANAQFDGTSAVLEADAENTSTATGSLSTQVNLTASAILNALATGNFTTQIVLIGQAQSVATGSGILGGRTSLQYPLAGITQDRPMNSQKSYPLAGRVQLRPLGN